MRKIAKIILVFIILFVTILSVGCTKEETDGKKFKEEYEALNGEKTNSGKEYRTLLIPEDNPMVYLTDEELVEKIENKESMIVYFGFAKCPWCRSVLLSLLDALEKEGVKEVYYVDVLDIRDAKEINADGDVVVAKEGTEAYYKLVKYLGEVLDDYTIDEMSIDEKRIYAPNVVTILKGKPLRMTTGISDELEDPYGELTQNVKDFAFREFQIVIQELSEKERTCTKTTC